MARIPFLLVLAVAASLLAVLLARRGEKPAPAAEVVHAAAPQQAPPPSPVTAVREPALPPPPVPAPPAPVAVVPPVETEGAIAGQVKVAQPVRRKTINIAACCPQHGADGPIESDECVVDKDLNLKWAFVYVKSGAPPSKEPPQAPVILDQKDCVYRPHVLGVQVGQPLVVRNSDSHLHCVHTLPFINREWNFTMPQPGDEPPRRFHQPEIMVLVKCDIHPWMRAWIGVLEHPYFAVTDDAGRFRIPGLPAGRYTVEVWHEKYKSKRQELEILGGTAAWNVVMDERKE